MVTARWPTTAGRRSRRRLHVLPLLPLCLGVAAGLGGCVLPDEPIGQGIEVVVVHAVVHPDSGRRIVVIEHSLSGRPLVGGGGGIVPPSSPDFPLIGAHVEVSNLDYPADPCGASVRFVDSLASVGGVSRPTPGVYYSPIGCPTIRPGDVLELRALIGDGVRGRTRVPVVTGGSVRAGTSTGRLDAADTIRLNRDRDTLVVAMDGSGIRGVYTIVQRTGTGPPPLEAPVGQQDVAPRPQPSLETFGDSSGIALAGTIHHTFLRGTGEPTFRGGRRYRVAVAAMDTNYFDFLATEANELTGRGFRNRLEGAVGVFGSMVPRTVVVRAEADADDPREGVYQLEGTVSGVAISITVEAYLGPAGDSASAFMSGDWTQLSVGVGWEAKPVADQSVDGVIRADSIELLVPTIAISVGPGLAVDLLPLVLAGGRVEGQSFPVDVFQRLGTDNLTLLGTLTATQQ